MYKRQASDSGIHFVEDSTGWPNEQFGLYHLGRFDLDGDRAPDIIGHGTIPIAQILRNTNGAAAARMAVRLVGTTANSHAVGSIVEVYAGGTRQMQQVDAGADYITQHSYTRFFGMGDMTLADSVVVTWPGGAVETWYDLGADDHHTLIQGTAGLAPVALDRDCPWEAQGWLVPAFPGAPDVTLDGVSSTTDTIWMTSSDTLLLEVQWWNGTQGFSWSLASSVMAVPDEGFQYEPPACHGSSGWVSWSAGQAASVVWADSLAFPLDTAFMFAGDAIEVQWMYGDNCVVDTAVTVTMPEALTWSMEVVQPACHGEWAEVYAEAGGGTPPLIVDWAGADPAALGAGIWPVTVVDAAGCVLQDTAEVVMPDSLMAAVQIDYVGDSDTAFVTLDLTGGTPPYDISWSEGLDAEGWVLAPVTLSWLVVDAAGCASQGVLSIGVNGGMVIPSCEGGLQAVRIGHGLQIVGAEDAGRFALFDLTGRTLAEGTWRTGDRISVPVSAPIILNLTGGRCGHQVMLK